MADLTITASEVQPDTTGTIEYFIAAAAITPGQCVYKNASGQMALSDNDLAGAKTVYGIALNTAAAGQTVGVQTKGTVTIGSSAAVADTAYFLSSTAGGIMPAADIASGDTMIYLGTGQASDDTIKLAIDNSGRAVA